MQVSTERRLKLAPHVRACVDDQQVILLDLRRSKYLGIAGPQSCALADQIGGWPRNPDWVVDCVNSVASSALTQRLLSQGMVTDTPSERLPDATVEEATSSLDFETSAAGSKISVRRVGRFFHSAAVAALWMRCMSLQSIASAVSTRRERLQHAALDSGAPDAMWSSAAAYERLRPLAMSAQDKCLHDSLALISFLALEGAFPRWVIGVKTRPFGAHSWVQSGGTVLNDQHENVRRFRPILVV